MSPPKHVKTAGTIPSSAQSGSIREFRPRLVKNHMNFRVVSPVHLNFAQAHWIPRNSEIVQFLSLTFPHTRR